MKVTFVLLGTGCSNALPNLRHVLQEEAGCLVCADALRADSRNRRGTPSMLVRVEDGGEERSVLIDCGKSFYESVCRVLPGTGQRSLDAVLLTHGHMDAIGGLDNLREIQLAKQDPSDWSLSGFMPVYGTAATGDIVTNIFSYLFKPPAITGRVVGCLRWETIPESLDTIHIVGLPIQLLPVLHGGDYIAMGFAFGPPDQDRVVYLSDVKEVPAETLAVLKGMRISTLLVDALRVKVPNYSHFTLDEALELINELAPKKAYIIGMSCDFDHTTINAELASQPIPVELSYDGLQFTL